MTVDGKSGAALQDSGPAGLQGRETSRAVERARKGSVDANGGHAANGKLPRPVKDVALIAGEERFRTALSSMVDPVAVVTAVMGKDGSVADFVVTYSNERPGTPRVGVLLSSLWSSKPSKSLLSSCREVLDGKDLVFDGLLVPGFDGADRFLDIRAARLDELEVIATWRDVTERVKAEAALADSEALLRGAFDDAPAGALLIAFTAEGSAELLRVNRTFAALTGYRRQDLLGMQLTRLLHPDYLDAAATPQALLERAGEPLRLLRADGGEVWVRLSGTEVALDEQPTHLVIHVEDVTSRLEIEQELEQRSLYDPLTGLPNRHLLLDRFRTVVDGLGRRPGAVAVLHIDLDRFKDVNDTYGHVAGDHVLAEVGRRLDALVDSPDTAARLAGDEFVIITAARASRRGPSAATSAATRLADQVADVVGQVIHLPEHDDVSLQLSVSIGISVTTSAQSEPEQVLLQADRAMFEAKRRGRRRYELFRQSLSGATQERLRVEGDVRDAIANDWLRLYYQPVIDLTTGRLGGAEALLRIAHPQRGLLAPASFINVLEDSELIIPIGDWVLAEACRQLRIWQDEPGFADFSMAVNVSGRQASGNDLSQQALAAVAKAGVDPRQLCLEMTERMLIDADDSVVDDLRRLTAEGVQIALDDFGTGYASLSYLQRFPVSTLKIDRSFVEGMGVTATDTAIVASVVALAQALDLDVIAEGVETEGQLDQLRSQHCAKAQGFFFAPALEADAFERGWRDRPNFPEK
jgi:diguanylate cyclase (GGDEF)-like protein/PAS domain S-box-containing protein